MEKRSTLASGVLVLLLLGGCGLGGGSEVASLEPRADLAQKAVLTAVDRMPDGAPSGGKHAATEASVPRGDEGGGEDLATLDDPRGDHGEGPRYADLSQVTLTGSTEALTVSVALDAVVPARLPHRQIENVGLDLYRTSPLDTLLGRTESDYRVRLDGDAYGWRAFLRTRDGYVAFPGEFTVNGPTLRVVLPWEAIGGRSRAEVEAFVDWSSGVGRLTTDGSTRLRLVP